MSVSNEEFKKCSSSVIAIELAWKGDTTIKTGIFVR